MAINQVMLPGYAAYHIGYQATLEEAAEEDAGPDDTAGDDVPQPAAALQVVSVNLSCASNVQPHFLVHLL